MKQGDKYIKTKNLSIFIHHFSPCPSVTSNDNSGFESHMFTITIENLLRFHEYSDDKMISMKNFPLGFGKVQSNHLSCGFFAQMWKDLEEKR